MRHAEGLSAAKFLEMIISKIAWVTKRPTSDERTSLLTDLLKRGQKEGEMEAYRRGPDKWAD